VLKLKQAKEIEHGKSIENARQCRAVQRLNNRKGEAAQRLRDSRRRAKRSRARSSSRKVKRKPKALNIKRGWPSKSYNQAPSSTSCYRACRMLCALSPKSRSEKSTNDHRLHGQRRCRRSVPLTGDITQDCTLRCPRSSKRFRLCQKDVRLLSKVRMIGDQSAQAEKPPVRRSRNYFRYRRVRTDLPGR